MTCRPDSKFGQPSNYRRDTEKQPHSKSPFPVQKEFGPGPCLFNETCSFNGLRPVPRMDLYAGVIILGPCSELADVLCHARSHEMASKVPSRRPRRDKLLFQEDGASFLPLLRSFDGSFSFLNVGISGSSAECPFQLISCQSEFHISAHSMRNSLGMENMVLTFSVYAERL
jgi:hypothetical protein